MTESLSWRTWRLKRPAYKILDEQKFLKYSSLIRDLMKDIDDDVIYRQRNIYMNMKMYAFSLKYGSDARKNLELIAQMGRRKDEN